MLQEHCSTGNVRLPYCVLLQNMTLVVTCKQKQFINHSDLVYKAIVKQLQTFGVTANTMEPVSLIQGGFMCIGHLNYNVKINESIKKITHNPCFCTKCIQVTECIVFKIVMDKNLFKQRPLRGSFGIET